MSMINEFVKKLRFYASEYNELPYGREVEGTGDLLKEAADIIEELSTKLASANMDRSEQYYKGNSEFVEKLRGRLKKELQLADEDKRKADVLQFDRAVGYANGMAIAIDILNKLAEEYKDVPNTNVGKWIPVSEKLPDTETEVIVLAKRNFKGGDFRYIITTALYEDGTVLENDSIWHWNDLDGEWNEEEDCYIIPRGWWEYRHYNMDEVYNNAIDDEVVAWQPLPEPYKGE